MTTRAGFVALIGEPNAGKSTLTNRMVGRQGVDRHPQGADDPRAHPRRGDRGRGADRLRRHAGPVPPAPPARPGDGRGRLGRGGGCRRRRAADRGAPGRDGEGVERILEGLADIGKGRKVALAINKIDKVKSEVLLALTEDMNERFDFAETFMISAEKGHGVEDLRAWLAGEMPEGPWLYPEDQIADIPLYMIAAEITREKLTLRLHQELPYQLTVETENWEERQDGSARIDQLIYVARDGHKGHRARQEGRDDQGGEPGGARRDSKSFSAARCTCSCRSRCGPAGSKRPSAIPRWGSNFKDGNR